MNKLTAIIINYNTKEITNKCINALKDSIFDIPFEIIVVDNASKDDSFNFLKQKHPDIKIIANSINTGFSYACNQAIANAMPSMYYLFVNSDTIPNKKAITMMLNYLDNNRDTAIVGAQLINNNGTQQHSFANYPSLITETISIRLLNLFNKKKYPFKTDNIKVPFSVESIIGAFFMIKSEIFKKVGGFDQRYFFFLEETDLCKKVTLLKKTIIFLPQARIKHLQGASANKKPIWSRHNFYRSKYQFLKKWYGIKILVIIYIKNYCLFLVKSITYLALHLIFVLKNSKLQTKFNTSSWILRNHFLGFPPFVVRNKQKQNKSKIKLNGKTQNYSNFTTFFKNNQIVICFKNHFSFHQFLSNYLKLKSIAIKLPEYELLNNIIINDIDYPYGISMIYKSFVQTLPEYIQNNISLKNDILQSSKNYLKMLKNKSINLKNDQEDDFLVQIDDQHNYQIELLNFHDLAFGFFL